MDRRLFIHALNAMAAGSALTELDLADARVVVERIRELGHLIHGSDSASGTTQSPSDFIQLCRCITKSVATEDCYVGVDLEDFRHYILEKGRRYAFGFGTARGVNGAKAATDLAVSHPRLGQGRLQQASAALVAIEAPPNALREARDIMLQVRRYLPANSDILYSCVSTKPVDGDAFRVSILASGIHDA
jgi:cell division GTPase FtsZ